MLEALRFLSIFKKKILIGNSEDTVVAIIEHLVENSNLPFEIEINYYDIVVHWHWYNVLYCILSVSNV